MSYNPSTQVFSANSGDSTLIGKTKPYSLEAEFVTYPKDSYSTVSTAEATSFIQFDNPCSGPTLVASGQNDAPPDAYTGNPITVQLNRFIVLPAGCPETYSCTAVTRVDGQASKIGCEHFDFDGVFDGDQQDGLLSLSADSGDY